MTDWIILRTAGSSTLPLAKSLADAGYEVWSPVEIETVEKRKPGTNLMIKVDVQRALIPPFVFAKADQLHDLISLSRSPSLTFRAWDSEKQRMIVKGYPKFSFLSGPQGYARVPDEALNHLRVAERKRKPRGAVKVYKVGDAVKLTEGAYGGLRGTVVAVKGKKAVVAFRGSKQDTTVPMWLLLDDESVVHIEDGIPERVPVARAA